ncbi:MAG: glucose-1-phosphate thymidylyltransferase RfbA [Patescibacteria group bacterium]
MKGIILAGGYGTRLRPITIPTVKQLLPIYDKPLIYYPLSVLMMAGVKDILIISTPRDLPRFIELFGNGADLGLSFSYAIQDKPRGLPDAFVVGERFIDNEPVWLILGDNLFFGDKLESTLEDISRKTTGAAVFAYKVKNPELYGVVEFSDGDNKVISLEEKPLEPKSNYALTGLYFFDGRVSDYAKSLTPSVRGETEITDLMKKYLENGELSVERLGSGFAWLDTGSCDSMYDASTFVKVMQTRQGVLISSPEEIAYRKGFIDKYQFARLAESLSKTDYGQYLLSLVKEGQ